MFLIIQHNKIHLLVLLWALHITFAFIFPVNILNILNLI